MTFISQIVSINRFYSNDFKCLSCLFFRFSPSTLQPHLDKYNNYVFSLVVHVISTLLSSVFFSPGKRARGQPHRYFWLKASRIQVGMFVAWLSSSVAAQACLEKTEPCRETGRDSKLAWTCLSHSRGRELGNVRHPESARALSFTAWDTILQG